MKTERKSKAHVENEYLTQKIEFFYIISKTLKIIEGKKSTLLHLFVSAKSEYEYIVIRIERIFLFFLILQMFYRSVFIT